MKPIDIKEITAQNPAGDRTRRRWRTGKFLILSGVVAVSYVLEWKFQFDEEFHDLVAAGEFFEADAVVLSSFTFLVTFLIIKVSELKRETLWRKTAQRDALILAFHDPLTGLGNRRWMEQALEKVGPDETRAMLMIDVDDFKSINDLLGHYAGDAVLIEAGRRLRDTCEPDDIVCRIGGDEFAMLTGHSTDVAGAELLAKRIVAAFEKPFDVGGNTTAPVSVSIGVSIMHPRITRPAEAMRQADLALYCAKEDPLYDFRFFAQAMDDEMRRRKHMEHKLRKAIELGAVRSYFQPIVDLKTSEVIGFEALARWNDPELGNVPPGEFIALAEESGLISELSDCLLRAACQTAAEWPPHLRLSFNLSPTQLKDKLLGLRILKVLGETGLSPRRLEIEVTESSLVEDKETAQVLLSSLRQAGVRIAIDDFGTGYSSLYHLCDFKFDNLKIDRSFVMAMEMGNTNEMIVNAILNLARGLGLTVTAEGIEREDHASSLLASGCQQGQGYLFGRPMPAAEVMAMIEELSPEAQRA